MTIVVRNDLAELHRVGRVVSEFWIDRGLPSELEGDVNLALEEILANVIRHGYGDSREHEIVVRLEADGGEVRVAVEDDGVPFNPLEDAPAVDITAPLAERPIGGLGLFLVRHLMDRLDYERRGERNLFSMAKKVRQA
jgi:anti-sigma regulatory factor (Ser/Thr protein kinase)